MSLIRVTAVLQSGAIEIRANISWMQSVFQKDTFSQDLKNKINFSYLEQWRLRHTQFRHILKTDKRSKSAGPIGSCPSEEISIIFSITEGVSVKVSLPYLNLLTLEYWKPWKGTLPLANSEDPDEMKHKAAFHQGLHCFLRLKQPSATEIHYLENCACDPLNYTMGSPILYCINMYGEIYKVLKEDQLSTI